MQKGKTSQRTATGRFCSQGNVRKVTYAQCDFTGCWRIPANGERNKLLPFRESCFLARIADQILAAKPDELLVVVGHEQERTRQALASRPIQFVENPSYAEGMTTSIQAGIQAASPEALGFMICLSDLHSLRQLSIRN